MDSTTLRGGSGSRGHCSSCSGAAWASTTCGITAAGALPDSSAPGRLNFASNGAELRVLAPSGGEEHRRELLPPGRYAPVAVRLLRKADGTGLAIVPTAGGALPEGRYRLRFTFHRDNRARDPGSQLLRQAGATGPEVVELDVPGTG